MNKQPLAGLNIVVTRPREQADYLAQGIRALGGHAILFPLLTIEPQLDSAALRELIARISQFDLAIFISPNAVRFGLQAIGKLPLTLRLAAVGQGTARALAAASNQPIIAPHTQFDSEALLALPELNAVQNLKIVIFRGDGGRELLGDTLTARGALVEYANCYRRNKPAATLDILLTQTLDALTISSSEALRNLAEMPKFEALRALPLFVPHPRIAAAAQQFGWQNIINTASGDDELLSSLVGWSQRNHCSP
jgi:uroporphyrinogen-III synthase